MAVIYNAINFGLGFNIGAKAPIDSRFRVEYFSDLTVWFTGSQFPAYDGMVVAVLEDGHVYRLRGQDSSRAENWVRMVDDSVLKSVLSSTGSLFNGTASYSQNGPFLHISGGLVTGSVVFSKTFAQGYQATASGLYSHAQGYQATASGLYSHAEGGGTISSGQISHAEGKDTTAGAEASHAEGCGTVATGQYSHTEGSASKASGLASHAGGNNTEAVGNFQTVVGSYNEPSADYAFIVGVGSGSYVSQSGEIVSESRKNGLAVGWDGDIDMIPGKILYGTASYALNIPVGGTGVEEASYIASGSSRIYFDTQNTEIVIELL